MGYQEAFFKVKEENMDALESYIRSSKKEIENPPWDYCYIPNTVVFKQDLIGDARNEEVPKLFRKGDKYVWAVGQRSAVLWLPRLFSDNGFEVEAILIEDAPAFTFEGLNEFMNEHWNNPNRPMFENEFILVEAVNYI